MKKILLASVLALTAFGTTAALADSTNIDVGAGASAGSSSGADASSNNKIGGSVGLAGLSSAPCSEGISLGAAGAGLGFNTLNRACVVAGQIDAAVKSGLISKAEGRAFWLASMKSLGFELVVPAN